MGNKKHYRITKNIIWQRRPAVGRTAAGALFAQVRNNLLRITNCTIQHTLYALPISKVQFGFNSDVSNSKFINLWRPTRSHSHLCMVSYWQEIDCSFSYFFMILHVTLTTILTFGWLSHDPIWRNLLYNLASLLFLQFASVFTIKLLRLKFEYKRAKNTNCTRKYQK